MSKCANCGAVILFGGVRDGTFRFCKKKCHEACAALRVINALPQEMIDEHLLNVHSGPCPRCKGQGPVDVHTGHRAMSFLVLTTMNSVPIVACRSCGIKHQAGSMTMTFFLGWWGFPYGLIFTPIQLIRNITGMLSGPDPNLPSRELEQIVRLQIGNEIAQSKSHPPVVAS
jgi:hypothetical protein